MELTVTESMLAAFRCVCMAPGIHQVGGASLWDKLSRAGAGGQTELDLEEVEAGLAWLAESVNTAHTMLNDAESPDEAECIRDELEDLKSLHAKFSELAVQPLHSRRKLRRLLSSLVPLAEKRSGRAKPAQRP